MKQIINPRLRRVTVKKAAPRKILLSKRALLYKRRGWAPIPITFRSKNPGSLIGNDWQRQRYTEKEIPQAFAGKKNIAVIMGKASHGLTDVDLDWPEARATAPFFLDATKCFGRKTSRGAHWLYITTLATEIDKARKTYSFPTPDRKEHIIELLIGGGGLGMCAIFPGSSHEDTGELIKWEPGNPGQPLKIDGQKLLKQMDKTAASALLAYKFPPAGNRHKAANVLGGWLARNGWKEAGVNVFVEAVAVASQQDNRKKQDMIKTAADAVQACQAGKAVYGYPEMIETFGPAAAEKVNKWLGFKEQNNSSETLDDLIDNKGAEDDEQSFTITPYVWQPPDTLPRRDWLWADHYMRGAATQTLGEGSVGKTSHVLVECVEMAQAGLRAWYWSGDETLDEINRRIGAIVLRYKIKPTELEGRLFVNSGLDSKSAITLVKMKGGTAVFSPKTKALANELLAKKIDVASIDPLVATHQVVENDNPAMNKVVRCYAWIANEAKCALDILHHTVKFVGKENEITINYGRGAGSFKDGVRAARSISTMRPSEAKNMLGEDWKEQRSCYYSVDNNLKPNMTAPNVKKKWFQKVSVSLGNERDKTDFGQEVGVPVPWTPPGPVTIPDNALDLVLEALQTGGPYAKDAQAKNWAGKAIGKALGLKSKDTKQIKGLLKTWLEEGKLFEVQGKNPRNRNPQPQIVSGPPLKKKQKPSISN